MGRGEFMKHHRRGLSLCRERVRLSGSFPEFFRICTLFHTSFPDWLSICSVSLRSWLEAWRRIRSTHQCASTFQLRPHLWTANSSLMPDSDYTGWSLYWNLLAWNFEVAIMGGHAPGVCRGHWFGLFLLVWSVARLGSSGSCIKLELGYVCFCFNVL